MHYLTLVQQWLVNINPVTTVMFILLVLSEVLGSVPSVKASSIYGVVVAVLTTLKDQAWPKA